MARYPVVRRAACSARFGMRVRCPNSMGYPRRPRPAIYGPSRALCQAAAPDPLRLCPDVSRHEPGHLR